MTDGKPMQTAHLTSFTCQWKKSIQELQLFHFKTTLNKNLFNIHHWIATILSYFISVLQQIPFTFFLLNTCLAISHVVPDTAVKQQYFYTVTIIGLKYLNRRNLSVVILIHLSGTKKQCCWMPNKKKNWPILNSYILSQWANQKQTCFNILFSSKLW